MTTLVQVPKLTLGSRRPRLNQTRHGTSSKPKIEYLNRKREELGKKGRTGSGFQGREDLENWRPLRVKESNTRQSVTQWDEGGGGIVYEREPASMLGSEGVRR